MIMCDVCEKSVAVHSLGTNKIVYGLLPVEVGSVGYNKAPWVDTPKEFEYADHDSGMAKFIHDDCLRLLINYSGMTVRSEMENNKSVW